MPPGSRLLPSLPLASIHASTRSPTDDGSGVIRVWPHLRKVYQRPSLSSAGSSGGSIWHWAHDGHFGLGCARIVALGMASKCCAGVTCGRCRVLVLGSARVDALSWEAVGGLALAAAAGVGSTSGCARAGVRRVPSVTSPSHAGRALPPLSIVEGRGLAACGGSRAAGRDRRCAGIHWCVGPGQGIIPRLPHGLSALRLGTRSCFCRHRRLTVALCTGRGRPQCAPALPGLAVACTIGHGEARNPFSVPLNHQRRAPIKRHQRNGQRQH